MIPVTLKLHNFLAYHTPTSLDLTGLHVACLAGANGAGKSALLDAVTWALWGRARARRDDELIHMDETEMQVALTFYQGGNLYQVTRYRTSQGRGSSSLDMSVQDGDEWRGISEATIRATQDKINRLLRLDYDTFINSAFLMQGRADEFTNKTPSERKTILGEILGLNRWTAYEDRAKRRSRLAEHQVGQIDTQLQTIDAELEREPDYKDDLIETQRYLATLTEQIDEVEARFWRLEEARRERDTLRSEQATLRRNIEQAQAELGSIDDERTRQLKRLEDFESVLEMRAEIEAGIGTLNEALQTERALTERLHMQSDLHQQGSTLQQAIDAARHSLEGELRALERERETLVEVAKQSDGNKALAEVSADIEDLEAREQERDDWKTQLLRIREERANLEGINRGLKAEMNTIKAERDLILETAEPVCPLCGQELSEALRADLLDRLETQGNEKGDAWRENQKRIEALDAEVGTIEKDIRDAEQELRKLPPLREHIARLRERIERADEAQSRLAEVAKRLEELEAALTAQDYALDEQARLAEVQERLAELGYDEDEYQRVRSTIDEYRPFEERKAQLDRALEAMPELKAALAKLDERATLWQQRLAEDQGVCDKLETDIATLDALLVGYEALRQELDDLREQEGQARLRVGAAQQRLEALAQNRILQAELLERRTEVSEEVGIYDELRLAFGKDGVPAMMIEAAIPEIEEGANQILSRMTDGRMHLRFDTQREKVTGGIKETLDIKIADELGTRDYATFSGGEAFRVNFAIRIALSRLLARRAGAQLRTLILDEGFGTQDAQGRERLVQAINAIQDDFDLILVITHIDELKEAFPARIEVTKTPNGAHVEIV